MGCVLPMTGAGTAVSGGVASGTAVVASMNSGTVGSRTTASDNNNVSSWKRPASSQVSVSHTQSNHCQLIFVKVLFKYVSNACSLVQHSSECNESVHHANHLIII